MFQSKTCRPEFFGVTFMAPKIELRDAKHLWIQYNPAALDLREVIIDEEQKDVRICDGTQVIKIRFKGNKILNVLVNDVVIAGPYI